MLMGAVLSCSIARQTGKYGVLGGAMAERQYGGLGEASSGPSPTLAMPPNHNVAWQQLP